MKGIKRKIKLKFRKPYEIGNHYAFMRKGRKVVGLYWKSSRVTKQAVTLYVQNKNGEWQPQEVKHALVIQDPWAAISPVPREEPPKCIIYKPVTDTDERYRNGGAQRPAKGKRLYKSETKM
jgi:hypothetical protein